ncbi:MAG: RlmE family RNA methyltransferase, partial [Deltaproteobacteria bacterium]
MATSKKNRWEDHYSRKAKKEKFPARSVYKLQEIQRKNRLIKKRDKVLDLGCSPGSWLL